MMGTIVLLSWRCAYARSLTPVLEEPVPPIPAHFAAFHFLLLPEKDFRPQIFCSLIRHTQRSGPGSLNLPKA